MHDGTSPPRTPALPRFAAQWYGLASLFGPIRIASHRITAASNPVAVVELELRNRYTVRLVGTTHGIASTVRILTDAAGPNNGDANAKTDRVEDRWEGKLPGGAVAEAFRKLNAVTVPALVRVPKTDEEDRKMQQERDKA